MSEKFRTWDSVVLTEAAGIATQIVAKVEQLCEDNELETPADLPQSLVPSDKLYILAKAYHVAFEQLTRYELLKTGNIKSTKQIH